MAIMPGGSGDFGNAAVGAINPAACVDIPYKCGRNSASSALDAPTSVKVGTAPSLALSVGGKA